MGPDFLHRQPAGREDRAARGREEPHPAVLELAGKNPTIVHSSAELKPAARRIAFTRFLKSGHVCTAPDHVLVCPEVKDEFVEHLKETIHDFYGDDPKQSPDYGRVINRKNFDRLVGFMGNGKIVAGGESDPEELYIAPTVLSACTCSPMATTSPTGSSRPPIPVTRASTTAPSSR